MKYLSIFAIAIALLLSSCNQPSQSTSDQKIQITALDSIYSLSQIEAVSEIFTTDCATCHGKDLRGTEGGNALIGTRFQKTWSEKSIGELFEYTKLTMPVSNPGTYDDETYSALLAYILHQNKYPAGEQLLSSNKKELDKIFPNKPILLWHRSFHEVILNSSALELLGIKKEDDSTNYHC